MQQLDAEHLVYHSPKQGLDGAGDLVLTPLELIGKIAALVPPPRSHRHRYYGVLAPNSPLRAAVIAMAPVIAPTLHPLGSAEKPRRSVSHYLWAMLLARIYEAFPLNCPICHAQMRIIAFINEAGDVRKILEHIGESAQPPIIAPARGPPLWELAEASAQAGNDPEWDTAEPAPEIEFDQSVAW